MENNYITRKINKNTKKYNFYDKRGNKINNNNILQKLYKIYIPPAYNSVKIYLNGDVLATGIDNAGRKQYIYSQNMKEKRENKKFCKLVKMSLNMSKLKKKVNNDLIKTEYSKNKLIAIIIKIMILCNFRCGNKKYEEKYGSHGLTTLHKKHIFVEKDKTIIDFIGKKGVINNCIINNKKINNIIKKLYKLSSKSDPYLFSINDGKKEIKVDVNDLNKYLDHFDVTSKDLRTWNANIIFLKNFKNIMTNFNEIDYNNKTEKQKINIRKKIIRVSIINTALELHNTPHVCKNSYIYKSVMDHIQNDEQIFLNMSKYNIKNEDFLKKILEKDVNYKKCKILYGK
jgi:DNA topoisomerase-1